MANSLTVSLSAILKDSASEEKANFSPDDDVQATPTQGQKNFIEAATGGTTLDTSNFTTGTCFGLKNTDGANFVTVTWTDSAANSNTQKIPAGGLFHVPDFDPATDPTITADTANVICELIVAGT